MLLLNFAHPLADDQLEQIGALVGMPLTVRSVTTHVDRGRPIADVALELVEAAGLSAIEWQTLLFLINPPGLAPLALALVAELHGRCGYFPAFVNIRPVVGATPPRYEVAEIVNLQAVRDAARDRRKEQA